MYWLIHHFPEFDHLDPDQRAQVLARIPWWTYPLLALSALVPALALAGVIAVPLAFNASPTIAEVVAIPLAAITAVALYARQLARLRASMRTTIATAFRGQRLPFCFHCGYDLRDSTTPLCPECGTAALGGATP